MKTYNTNIPRFSLAKTKSEIPKAKIHSSKDAADYARQFFADDIEIYESVFIILLNRANNTVGWAKISQGGISASVIDVKIILKYVVEAMACAVIIAHNHPSGNLQPSHADITVTQRIKNATTLLDSSLVDHIILSSEGYYSFADEGIL
jgi:DNA repair protein RadC